MPCAGPTRITTPGTIGGKLAGKAVPPAVSLRRRVPRPQSMMVIVPTFTPPTNAFERLFRISAEHVDPQRAGGNPIDGFRLEFHFGHDRARAERHFQIGLRIASAEAVGLQVVVGVGDERVAHVRSEEVAAFVAFQHVVADAAIAQIVAQGRRRDDRFLLHLSDRLRQRRLEAQSLPLPPER